MIARHETHLDKIDIWSALSAPLPADVISWRQDGRAITRDGRHFARFVAYIEANTVRERLDAVVPGEWDLTLELLPTVASLEDDANQGACSFKARLQILGVIREDVGTGKDFKQAATDAFKRAAVRFGIGHELYAYEQNWVPMDGDGRYAKPVEEPAAAYARRADRLRITAPLGAATAASVAVDREAERPVTNDVPAPNSEPASSALVPDEASCPKCGGRTWDNRVSKRNLKAPDFKCRDRACDGVIWPPKLSRAEPAAPAAEPVEQTEEIPF